MSLTMRTVALVLACLACEGHGGRVKVTSDPMQDYSSPEHQNSQKAGNTTPSSHSLAELEESHSNAEAGVPMLFPALSNPAVFAPRNRRPLAWRGPVVAFARHGHGPADAFAPRLAPVAGHRHRLAMSNPNALKPQTSGFASSDHLKGAQIQMEEEKRKMQLFNQLPQTITKEEYNLNLVEAVNSLNRDIPLILRFEDDVQRVAPMNWNIYTDSLETDWHNIGDPTMRRLLIAMVRLITIRTKGSSTQDLSRIKGLSTHQQALQELRTLCLKFDAVDEVIGMTRVGSDPFLYPDEILVDDGIGVQFLESRWRAELASTIPFWLLPVTGFWKSREWIVKIEAVSRFHLNAEGKIYRHSVDQLEVLVDQQRVEGPQIDFWLSILAGDNSLKLF